MRTIAVTGVSGVLGRRLAEHLESAEGVTRVAGIDVVEPAYGTRNLEAYRLDVRSHALRDVLEGCDAVVHLASASGGVRRRDEMHDVAVSGTRNVLLAAAEAGVGHVVHASSTLVYGAHPDNDVPLTEDAPVRPSRDLAWSSAAAAAEDVVNAFRESEPGVAVAVLRLAPVVGPRSLGALGGLLDAPVLLGVRGTDAPLQVIDERDAAAALAFAVERRLPGVYNVAADGWLGQQQVAHALGRRRVELTQEQTAKLLDVLWTWGLADVPPAALPFLMFPCVASAERIREAGFRPTLTAQAALEAAAEASRGWICIGRVRFRPRNVAALAGAAAVGASIVVREARRRLVDVALDT